jgi:mRNA interferase YafQ
MPYRIKRTGRFKRDYKLIKKRGYDVALLAEVVRALAEGKELPAIHRDHNLIGDWAHHRECHVQADWLLIYRVFDQGSVLVLSRTGTHSDLFSN